MRAVEIIYVLCRQGWSGWAIDSRSYALHLMKTYNSQCGAVIFWIEKREKRYDSQG